jgi:hypothetical protein
MSLCIYGGDELLIIAFWLAMELVEHIRDLKRSERHVSMLLLTVVNHKEDKNMRRYKNFQRSPGVIFIC